MTPSFPCTRLTAPGHQLVWHSVPPTVLASPQFITPPFTSSQFDINNVFNTKTTKDSSPNEESAPLAPNQENNQKIYGYRQPRRERRLKAASSRTQPAPCAAPPIHDCMQALTGQREVLGELALLLLLYLLDTLQAALSRTQPAPCAAPPIQDCMQALSGQREVLGKLSLLLYLLDTLQVALSRTQPVPCAAPPIQDCMQALTGQREVLGELSLLLYLLATLQAALSRTQPAPCAAPPIQDCMQALSGQRELLEKLNSDEPMSRAEFSKSLSYVTAAVCNSTEFAAQSAYLKNDRLNSDEPMTRAEFSKSLSYVTAAVCNSTEFVAQFAYLKNDKLNSDEPMSRAEFSKSLSYVTAAVCNSTEFAAQSAYLKNDRLNSDEPMSRAEFSKSLSYVTAAVCNSTEFDAQSAYLKNDRLNSDEPMSRAEFSKSLSYVTAAVCNSTEFAAQSAYLKNDRLDGDEPMSRAEFSKSLSYVTAAVCNSTEFAAQSAYLKNDRLNSDEPMSRAEFSKSLSYVTAAVCNSTEFAAQSAYLKNDRLNSDEPMSRAEFSKSLSYVTAAVCNSTEFAAQSAYLKNDRLNSDEPMSRAEFSKSLSYVTAAVCNSTEFAAQSAYLITLSEKNKELAVEGLVDVPRLQKLTAAMQESCYLIMRSNQVETAKEEESKLSRLNADLQHAVKEASARTKDSATKRELTERAFKVDHATKTLGDAVTGSDMDKITTHTLTLVDCVGGLNATLERPGLVPAVGEVSAETKAMADDIMQHSKTLINKTQALIKEVKNADDDEEPMTWVTYNTQRKSVIDAFEALLRSVRQNGERSGLVQAEKEAEEEPDVQTKSFIQIQEETARKWLQRRPSNSDVQMAGEEAARALIDVAQNMTEDMKDPEKEEIVNVIAECRQLVAECSKKYDNDKASLLMEHLRELRRAVQRGVVTSVVEDLLHDEPLQDLELFIEQEQDAAKRKFLLEKKLAELMSQLGRTTRTARLLARAGQPSSELDKCREQVNKHKFLLEKKLAELMSQLGRTTRTARLLARAGQRSSELDKCREQVNKHKFLLEKKLAELMSQLGRTTRTARLLARAGQPSSELDKCREQVNKHKFLLEKKLAELMSQLGRTTRTARLLARAGQPSSELDKCREQVNKHKFLLEKKLAELMSQLGRTTRTARLLARAGQPSSELDKCREQVTTKLLNKLAELMSQLGRTTRTARLLARAGQPSSELDKCREQTELLAPKLVAAAQARVSRPDDARATDEYRALLAEYAASLARVRRLCDQAVDPLDFVQTAGETMARMREESTQHGDPMTCAYTSKAITRLEYFSVRRRIAGTVLLDSLQSFGFRGSCGGRVHRGGFRTCDRPYGATTVPAGPKLASRVISVSMSSRVARADPELRAALADAQDKLAAAVPAPGTRDSRLPDWKDTTAEILKTTGEVESALGGENIFKKLPEPDQPIYNAALSLHSAVRGWSARDNEIVGVAKRMAVLMARLSDQMNTARRKESVTRKPWIDLEPVKTVDKEAEDRKRELIVTSKNIVKESNEVAALAKKLANECSDVRIKMNLLQVCERIPTISGQLKMLTVVKGSTLGNQGGEEDREAMNMLVTNAQNLMSSVQEVVKAAASASVKIASQRGLKWVRKNY
ncbi:vinculin family domain-containing protein [Phthorimaea operculella]|nr:vinculin family domain-containing protein [Phthorimaea operculella]